MHIKDSGTFLQEGITKALGTFGYIFGKADTFIAVSKRGAKNYKELDINVSNIKDFRGISVLQYK